MVNSGKKKRVLFLCSHNSGRSQIAEGIVNSRYSDFAEASTVGTKPANVNPLVIAAMKEMGVDI